MEEKKTPAEALRDDPRGAALLRDRKALTDLLGSREAQALAGVLRQLGGEDLQGAAGDGEKLRALLGRVMADPAGAKAVEELRRKTGG